MSELGTTGEREFCSAFAQFGGYDEGLVFGCDRWHGHPGQHTCRARADEDELVLLTWNSIPEPVEPEGETR